MQTYPFFPLMVMIRKVGYITTSWENMQVFYQPLQAKHQSLRSLVKKLLNRISCFTDFFYMIQQNVNKSSKDVHGKKLKSKLIQFRN